MRCDINNERINMTASKRPWVITDSKELKEIGSGCIQISADNREIAIIEDRDLPAHDNAELIVKAVNCHELLINTLDNIYDLINTGYKLHDIRKECLGIIKEALKKVGE